MANHTPTPAAMRACVAFFGTGPEYGPEWLAKRAAVIDHETGLAELIEAAESVLAVLGPAVRGSEHLACVRQLRDVLSRCKREPVPAGKVTA